MKCIKDNWILLFLVFLIFLAAVISWIFIKHIEGNFGSIFPEELDREK